MRSDYCLTLPAETGPPKGLSVPILSYKDRFDPDTGLESAGNRVRVLPRFLNGSSLPHARSSGTAGTR